MRRLAPRRSTGCVAIPWDALRKGAVLAVAVVAALAGAGAAWESPPGRPAGQRVEVVVELAAPALVDAVGPTRAPSSAARRTGRLDLASAASRDALARIRQQQATLERRILAAVPSARVAWRYQIVLNGLAVVVPVAAVRRLDRLPGVAHVTRSVTYHRQLDSTPGQVGAQTLWGGDLASTGQGVKIAILDDGIEVTHPFFSPAGFTAPPDFPRGQTQFTSAKVIVARAFPAPGATWKYAASAYDPDNTEHGIHVAGIAAGDHDTVASVDGVKRTLSGVAPGAYLGNYKVLTTPTPGFGLDGNAPEIAAGIESAVKDGMDVINLSLGEPEIAPERDVVVKALSGAARAGVVPVVAAGNDFDVIGTGSLDSPGNTPEAITVAAATKSGLIADFSSAGPTPISLQLKPDVTAPGVNIYSSYPTREQSWSSLSGTSMATPVVSGSAALLRQRHPTWTPAQIKSALTTTGGPVYGTDGRRQEVPPTREGGGMIDLGQADKPLIFVSPTSLSFGFVSPGATVTRTIDLSDAGGGGGDWLPAVRTARGGRGVRLAVPAAVHAPDTITVSLSATALAAEGETSGFIVLRGTGGDRRIPFWVRVTRPRLAGEPRTVLARPGRYSGNTKGRPALVSEYRYPDSGPAIGVPTVLSGPEQVFRVRIAGQVDNFGVVVTAKAKGVDIQPRVVVAGDENRLTGMAGLPVDLNPYRTQFGAATPVAGAIRPLPGLYDIVFDTPSAAKSGAFTFRYWVNDTTPPSVRLLTPQPAAGSSVSLRLSITDSGSGVDPSALVVKIDDSEIGTSFDEATGIAVGTVSSLAPGTHTLWVSAADFQETRNMEDVPAVLPNTRTLSTTFVAH